MARLYIATWGNPLAWSEVEYDCGDGRRARSFTSSVCAEADARVVVALDSVVAAEGNNRAAAEAAREAGLPVEEVAEGGTGRAKYIVGPPDCGEWRLRAREYVRRLAGKAGVEAEPVVVAALGRLGGWEFRGWPDLVLWELLMGLWRVLKGLEPKGQLDIYLDITHGINFMPAVALHAARLLASLALARGFERAVLKAYNALPGTWQLAKVYSETFDSILFPQPPETDLGRALYYGAPLHFALLSAGAEEPELEVELRCEGRAVAYQIVDRKARSSDDRGPAQRGGAQSAAPERLYELLLAVAASEGARGLLAGGSRVWLKGLMQWGLVDRLGPTARAVAKAELNRLYTAAQKLSAGECRRYAELLPFDLPERGDVCGDASRHFIAHAGLLAHYTTVCRESGGEAVVEVDKETFKCLSSAREPKPSSAR
ncbi:CRISPR-associated DxTHG motif protein [Thermoproteus tenax]|uniref:CRISPR system associated protein n=1 Tax=Thermoproteus tenax (strain ATCC 35583 / DSM 2078 / JCM 9277 / NBRC 100435 / Kra 1) TaxID=768679 RepID=G4RJY4_THETK|nr:CRISPR-associated DxTHG motif protein [Thermoproteus tenax]CCC81879.1 CRISPR system associated protein [Thermoproteus tenax Kra 1]